MATKGSDSKASKAKATSGGKKTTKTTNIKTTQSKKTVKNKVAETNTATTAKSLHGIAPYSLKKGEEYMNKSQREHFEAILNAWKRSLMEEVDRTMTHMQEEAANFPDPTDRASLEEGFSLELRTRDRERKLLRKIEEAIERIRTDDFGYCELCGVEIGIRRLEARPTATLCIDCKEVSEVKEKATAG